MREVHTVRVAWGLVTLPLTGKSLESWLIHGPHRTSQGGKKYSFSKMAPRVPVSSQPLLASAQLTAQAPTQIIRPLSFVGLDPGDAEKGWEASTVEEMD